MNVSVATRKCCGHFFVASIAPADRRMSTLFLTSPRIRIADDHPEFHPVRVMTRIVLRAGDLAPEQLRSFRLLPSRQHSLSTWVAPAPKTFKASTRSLGNCTGNSAFSSAIRLIQNLHCCTTGERL
jgi:hypothetical protein